MHYNNILYKKNLIISLFAKIYVREIFEISRFAKINVRKLLLAKIDDLKVASAVD